MISPSKRSELATRKDNKARYKNLTRTTLGNIVQNYKTAIVVCAALISIPYLIFPDVSFFKEIPVVEPGQHIVICIILFIQMFGGAYLGQALDIPKPLISSTLDWQTVRKISAVFVLTSIVTHAVLVVVAGGAFIGATSLRFVAARDNLPFEGFGIPLRLYMFALPCYVAACRFTRTSPLAMVSALGIAVLIRSVILSERMALAEYAVCVGLPLITFGYIQITLQRLVILLTIFIALLVVLLEARLSEQATAGATWGDASWQELFKLTVLYYADTMNKFHALITGIVTYDGSYLVGLYRKLTGQYDNGYGFISYLIKLQNSGISDLAMTNPGGPTQDWNDFGYYSLVVIILKFWLFGRLYRSYRSFRLAGLMFYPVMYFTILEYPRYNYYLFPYTMGLLIIGILTYIAVWFMSKRGWSQDGRWYSTNS